jgi:DNA mismatch repair protein MutS2
MDEKIARKIQKINRKEEEKVRKLSGNIQPKTPKDNQNPEIQKSIPEPVFARNDTVRLKGQQTVGTILDIQGKKAQVAFGMVKSALAIDQLEHAAPKKEKENPYTTLGRRTSEDIHEKKLQFKQDIDVRGMRGDEALQAVMYYIDDAIMTGVSRVRILHGTGTGILRQLIRQYLGTVPGVKQYHDEHVQFGGSGLTVVDLE